MPGQTKGLTLSHFSTRMIHNPNQRPHPKQRVTESTKTPTIDLVNEKLSEYDLRLHPTRGFKTTSPKRSLAQMRVAHIMQGGNFRVTRKPKLKSYTHTGVLHEL